jgi:hypothetical protein
VAKPPDRVQVLKQEVASDGGDPADDESGFPAPVNSTEDGLQAAGFYLGESGKPASDELVGGFREADKLKLFDSTIPSGVELSSLLSSGSLLPLETLLYTSPAPGELCIIVIDSDFVQGP